jgi:hypothetical protein
MPCGLRAVARSPLRCAERSEELVRPLSERRALGWVERIARHTSATRYGETHYR